MTQSNRPRDPNPFSNLFLRIGSVITVIYLLGVVAVAVFGWSKFSEMAPNEWGDFLAGTFGPIAFLWLVLGYLQQGQELRQNGEALKMQAEELAKSVEQHKELVKASQDQVAVNREAFLHDLSSTFPKFEFSRTKHSDEGDVRSRNFNRIDVILKCRNISAHNIKIVDLDTFWFIIEGHQSCSVDNNFHVSVWRDDSLPSDLKFSLQYSTSEGSLRRQDFHLQRIRGTNSFSPKVSK